MTDIILKLFLKGKSEKPTIKPMMINKNKIKLININQILDIFLILINLILYCLGEQITETKIIRLLAGGLS